MDRVAALVVRHRQVLAVDLGVGFQAGIEIAEPLLDLLGDVGDVDLVLGVDMGPVLAQPDDVRSGAAWMEAAVLGWTSLALTNSMVTLAPVSLLKPSSICFLKNGSASGMKLCHWSTERLAPFRFTAAGLTAGEAAGAAAGAPAAAGLAAGWAAGAAGLGASVGLAGAVAPPQAASSMTPPPLAAARRKFRRVRPRSGVLGTRDSSALLIVICPSFCLSGQFVRQRTPSMLCAE